jgi:MoaA/NifB/PqqE/SkfB family radical SAM enzyme
MTGGEPFLYPGFVELARLLTRAHYISVSTNLSTPNAYDFADAVEPDRVALINANLHILEREKSVNGVRKYLQKFLFFQEQGFNINLVYVTYPPLLGRIAEDIKWWRGQGVRSIVVKVFQGKFRDKRYSRDYTDEERSLLRGLGLNNCEEEILARRVSFLGTKCLAGHRAFAMDISGNVTRCTSLKEDYGNLFEETFRPGKFPRRCTARKCSCTYEGIHFAAPKGSLTPSHYVVRPARFCIAVAERLGELTRGTKPQPSHPL